MKLAQQERNVYLDEDTGTTYVIPSDRAILEEEAEAYIAEHIRTHIKMGLMGDYYRRVHVIPPIGYVDPPKIPPE